MFLVSTGLIALKMTELKNLFFPGEREKMWIYSGSDAVMALAYYFLAAAFIYFSYRKNFSKRLVILPSLFMFSAGTIHALHAASPWYSVEGPEMILKIAAAILAIGAALFIRHSIFPRVEKLEHPEATKKIIQSLNDQISAQKKITANLEKEKQNIESGHKEKIQTLMKAQDSLQDEMRQVEIETGLLPALAKSLEATQDFPALLETSLRQIGQRLGWEYGEAWVVTENEKSIECLIAWHEDPQYDELRRLSRELRFSSKMDLSGAVWASKEPRLIENLAAEKDNAFVRLHICRDLRLEAAAAVPVITHGKVLAVLMFLIKDYRPSDKRKMIWLSLAAQQLASVIERRSAEKNVREFKELQEKKVKERTQELTKAKEILEAQIVEHLSTEESLRKSEENYSSLVNTIDGIVWEYDLKNGRYTFVSEQAEKILGYPAGAWSAEHLFWQDHIHGGDRADAIAFRARLAQEKQSGKCEYRMITASGQTLWFRDIMTVVVEKNEVIKLRGVMVNITESKHAQEALSQERNFVSAVIETTSALVAILDTEGRIVRFNRACEQTSGYSIEEAKGKFFWEVFSVPEEIGKTKTIFTRLLAGQFPVNDETSCTAKDGSRHAIAWSNTVLLNRSGVMLHIIATGIDITKRNEVEQQLKEAVANLARSNKELDKNSKEIREANRRLRELDEIKSHFISAASHELKTPLTSIKGYVETILDDEVGPLNEKQREFLGYVKLSTDRLYRLLNELLDISKIESGQVRMNKEVSDLRDILKEEITLFKSQAMGKNVALNLETGIHLKKIYCDPDKIREVLDNLLSNAIKYTQRDGCVKIEADNYEEGVRIRIEDNGIGIRKEDLPRIFEPFQHIDKPGIEDEESTGLGLTLVKKIVDAHSGSVQVASEEGKGSVFTVILPVGTEEETTKTTTPWVITS